MRKPAQTVATTSPRQGHAGVLRDARGSQMVEFALVLPLLAVMLVAIVDFGAGWALKDKLSNAARDGTRVAVSEINDLTNSQKTACNGIPCSAQSAATTAVNYLTNAAVNTCGMNPAGSTASSAGAFAWSYSASTNCPGTMTVEVERAVPVVVNGTTALCTRVTITYPFSWSFARVIKLLAPSSTYSSPLTLITSETMQNLN